jgi:hypothetical protein
MQFFLNSSISLGEAISYHKQKLTFNQLKTRQIIQMMLDFVIAEDYIINLIEIYHKLLSNLIKVCYLCYSAKKSTQYA